MERTWRSAGNMVVSTPKDDVRDAGLASTQANDSAGPKRTPTAGEIDFFSKIAAADSVAEKAQQFARVSKFVMPFSAQLKTDLRDAYIEDKGIYDKADALQKSSADTYFLLRALTFSSFLIFMTIVVLLCYLHTPVSPLAAPTASWLELHQWLQNGFFLNLSIIVIAFVFYWIRRALRGYLLYNAVKHQVSQLAYSLGQAKNDLEKELAGASGRIELRQDSNLPNLSWAERAYGSAKILLWYAKRLEALDRYATTVMWKMDVFDARVETATWVAKSAVLAIGIGILWFDSNLHPSGIDPAILVAGALSAIAFVAIWILSNRADTDYWKQILIREVVPEEKQMRQKSVAGHYFNIVAVRVQNLVAQIIAAQRVSDKPGSGKQE